MNFTEITSIIGIMTIGYAIGRIIEATIKLINSKKKKENKDVKN